MTLSSLCRSLGLMRGIRNDWQPMSLPNFQTMLPTTTLLRSPLFYPMFTRVHRPHLPNDYDQSPVAVHQSSFQLPVVMDTRSPILDAVPRRQGDVERVSIECAWCRYNEKILCFRFGSSYRSGGKPVTTPCSRTPGLPCGWNSIRYLSCTGLMPLRELMRKTRCEA